MNTDPRQSLKSFLQNLYESVRECKRLYEDFDSIDPREAERIIRLVHHDGFQLACEFRHLRTTK